MKAWILAILGAASCLAEAPIEQMKENTVLIYSIERIAGTDKVRMGNGSGLVVGDRQVVTNWHVCCMSAEAPQGVRIETALLVALSKDKDTWRKARVVWSSKDKDLALLETEQPLGRAVVTFIERKLLKEGQTVWAVGFPGASNRIADVESNFVPTITQGIISKFMSGHTTRDTASTQLIQSTAAVNPGNSGGPLFNECGQVVGINRAKALQTVVTSDGRTARVTEADGINWTVQTDELLPDLRRLNVKYTAATAACVIGGAAAPVAMSNSMIAVQVGTVMIAIAAVFAALNRRTREAVVQRITTRRKDPAPQAPPLSRQLVLRGLSGYYAGTAIPIEGRPWIFGRDHAVANLVFPDEMTQISKRHCQLSVDPRAGAATLEDLWSSNGTFLDTGEKIEPGSTRTLRSGERFYLATRDNLFEIGTGAV